MRTIGHLDSEQSAARFSDYLFVQGIENQVENEDDGTFSVWILDEDQLPKASELIAAFRANPGSPQFMNAGALAAIQRQQEQKQDRARRSTTVDTARLGYERNFRAPARVTIVLIAICVVVALYSGFGRNVQPVRSLFISEYYTEPTADISINRFTEAVSPAQGLLPEVRAGEFWRVLTPIFLHFGELHLLFNMMMLWQLGGFIEARFSSRYLVLLVLATGILSNLAELLWSSPNFGGMSGVDYGLFGFLWIRGRFDRTASFQLNPNTVTTLLVWLVLCYTGILGSIANAAHTGGLLVGMAWGFLSAKR